MSRQEEDRREQAEQHIKYILKEGEAAIRRQIPSGKSSTEFDPILQLFNNTVARNEALVREFGSARYEAFIKETKDYLGVQEIIQTCGHDDIISARVTPPKVAIFHRRLGGDVVTRTTPFGYTEIGDPVLIGLIDSELKSKESNKNGARFLVSAGTHVNTLDPKRGCDNLASQQIIPQSILKRRKVMELAGHEIEHTSPNVSGSDGGLPVHFERLKAGFRALGKFVEGRNPKSKIATISMVYDAGTDYMIIGGKGVYERKGEKAFDRERRLRDNLLQMHHAGDVLMTEVLAQRLMGQISKTEIDHGLIMSRNSQDPSIYVDNIIRAGRIARIVTQNEEANNGFSWMPTHIKENEEEWAVRAAAYHAIYNIAAHEMLDRVRRRSLFIYSEPGIVRIGPEGYAHDPKPQSIEVVPPGGINERELITLGKLLVPERKQIIFVTGKADPPTDEIDRGEYRELTAKQVIENAERIKENFEGVRGVKPVTIPVFVSHDQSIEQIVRAG